MTTKNDSKYRMNLRDYLMFHGNNTLVMIVDSVNKTPSREAVVFYGYPDQALESKITKPYMSNYVIDVASRRSEYMGNYSKVYV